MLVSILQKAPILIVGLLLIIAAITIYFRAKNVNFTEFGQIFKTAKYFSTWVIILTILFTGVFGVFNHLKLRQSVHAIVSLNYSEASAAQNSNGTRYNMNEIISDEVIERAIKNGAFEGVTVKQLRNCLSVYPCVQGDVADETQYHISTEFAVEYRASKHTSHLDAHNVIKLIVASYKEYYIEKYTDNFSLDPKKPDFENMEYMDIVSYFNKETQSILNYLYGMAEKNSSFVTEDNATFNSIAGKVFQFKETQINQNFKSLVLQNGIAKDKKFYIERLSFQNKNTDYDRKRNQASFDLCNDAIDMYSEEMTRVVLVPTWDQEGKYYMGRTKVGIDEISVQATEFSDNVASNEKEIMDNKLIIDKMSDNKPTAETYAAANSLVDSIYKSIRDFEKEAIGAGREYSNYKMNQCIAVSIYGTSLTNELKTLVLFAALAYAAFMLYSISKTFPKKA